MMNDWHAMNLGDALTAHAPLAGIQEAFAAALASARRPPRMALFTRHDSEGRMHCEVVVYFSPAAADLARRFGARRCGKPARRGLDLLAGDQDAWALLDDEIRPAPRPA